MGLNFRTETAKNFSLAFHTLPLGSWLLFLSKDAKKLEVSTFKEDEGDCIRGLLSN
jgi:hypothetical protein